ncbi:hypothetical protein GGE66_001382 [Rhizobium leguminosarum]|uniref:Uncharacterized protein n=1 Tax=Rhizobium leguminosarum TaxID=384 RepID=A0A7W9ZQQ1_RHILE|nr:hypothetical protein [Rhizobium leguminosarum]
MVSPSNDELVFRTALERDWRADLLPISLLVGEMPGRAEGGATRHALSVTTGATPANSHT